MDENGLIYIPTLCPSLPTTLYLGMTCILNNADAISVVDNTPIFPTLGADHFLLSPLIIPFQIVAVLCAFPLEVVTFVTSGSTETQFREVTLQPCGRIRSWHRFLYVEPQVHMPCHANALHWTSRPTATSSLEPHIHTYLHATTSPA
ncbi:hypothetical protein F4809DRAFT_105991 [Biscogniauxia mediterranea]|nr:hypothetical protein F4809DRAFT_105991 [Biscogniauxia mediterranea]